MDVDGAVVGNDGLERELAVYVLCGKELEECGDRKVTYVGGPRKCIVMKEGTGVEEVQRMVMEIACSNLSEQTL